MTSDSGELKSLAEIKGKKKIDHLIGNKVKNWNETEGNILLKKLERIFHGKF